MYFAAVGVASEIIGPPLSTNPVSAPGRDGEPSQPDDVVIHVALRLNSPFVQVQ